MAAQNQLYVWDGVLLFAGTSIHNRRHRHYPASLLIGPEETFRLAVEDHPAQEHRIALMAPNTSNVLDSHGAPHLTLMVEADHPWFARLRARLAATSVADLPPAPLEALDTDWPALYSGRWSREVAHAWCESLVESFAAPGAPTALDPRIVQAIAILRSAADPAPTPREIGQQLGMSEFTLMRLFKATLGVRIGEYVLWRRLMRALSLFDSRRSLTDVAHEAGFYDQSHLTRTARRMSDLPPSFFADGGNTRVHI